MASFPTRPISEKYYSIGTYKKQLMSQFENGLSISRAAHTRARKQITVGWESMPKSEYINLMAFFEETVGSSFSFTDPTIGTAITVRFSSDALPKAKRIGWKYNDIGALEEAFDTGPIELMEF